MIDIIWQPAYTIKAYPELRGFFSRGENHLLAYLHNWTVQLTKKGKAQDPEWIFLTQQQIAESIDYSVSSVKRFINQINQKIYGAVEVRSKQVHLTKFFAYTVWEYRVNWPEVTGFLASQNDNTNILKTAEMAQSSHLHFELPIAQPEPGLVQDELGIAQNELIYKDQFKDQINNQINKKTSTPTPPQPRGCESEDRNNVEFLTMRKQQDYLTSQLNDSNIPAAQLTHNGEIIPPVSEKMNSLTSQQAAAMGLTRQNNPDGSRAWVDNPAGRSGGRSAWAEQGIALGLWPSKDMAFDFHGAVIRYGRNQDWCRSPLDYANSVIRGLIRGDDPKADRYWEAWRNELPIGWENLFDWEVQPGVINPAFLTWVSSSLYDGNKTAAGNAAEAAKQLRFNSRQLWESFQRAVAREVGEIDKHRDRGQTYLPPGAMLPRLDQPTTGETRSQLGQLMQAAELFSAPQLPAQNKLQQLAAAVQPMVDEVSAQDCFDAQENLAALIAPIGQMPFTAKREANHLDTELPESTRSPIPEPPLAVRLLSEIAHRRKLLELNWRRKSHKFDLSKAAKYLVWSEKGDDAMKLEAIDWLQKNYE
jgi:hypothetical protein